MDRIKSSRGASFAAVALVYALAITAGIIAFRLIGGAVWLRLLAADVIATVVTFAFSLIFNNASVYDPYWSVQPIVIGVCFAVRDGLSASALFALAAVIIWGVRLTGNWAYTFMGLDHEDWRYRLLRNRSGKFYPVINFIGIHMVPTIIVYLCTLPLVFLITDGAPLRPWALAFLGLSFAGTALELFADRRMHSFRRSGTGGFIREGLWKYSRHPNYLGEILMWWGIGLYSVSIMPSHWYLLGGALANTLLFLTVSIPMAEEKQSQKPGFEEYRNETRVLLPLKK